MMSRKIPLQLLLICLCMALLLVMGCRKNAPMYVPVEQSLANPNLSMQKMERVIKDAASARRWEVSTVKPGYIVATLHVRTHVVQVGITYTASSFLINYLDSTNMYAQDGTIHAQYNIWVQRLESDIRIKANAL